MNAAELKLLLDQYDDLYYTQGTPAITDAEYDALKAEYLVLTGQREYDYVPGEALGDAKFQHKYPIKSLEKVNTEDELRAELKRLAPGIIEPKYDGLTVVVYPQDSAYLPYTAVTRGNGEVGDDITTNVVAVKILSPEAINKMKYPVRMEAYLQLSVFKLLNIERSQNGEELFTNPRNAAAGIIRQKDPSKVKGLTFTAYDLVGCPLKETDKLNTMYHAGIRVPDPKKCFKFDESKIEEAVQFCLNFDRNSLDYEIDGLVIKSNMENSLAVFGETGHHPKNAIAYKFPSQGQWTTLEAVTWQVGRTGKLTPVAELAPVEILGSRITRCTMHNMGYVDAKNIHVGDEVFVVKANDIIPAITQARPLRAGAIEVTPIVEPRDCPVCNGPVEKVNDQSFCRNPLCKAKLLTGVMHLAKRDALDIADLAEGTIQKMIDAKLLEKPTDLFNITEQQIKELPGFAAKSAKSLYNNIQKARKTPLHKFIYAAGINGVGRSASKAIAKELGNFADLVMDIKAGGPRLSKVDLVGKVMLADILKYAGLLSILFMVVTPEDEVKLIKDINGNIVGANIANGAVTSAKIAPTPKNRFSFVLTGKMSDTRDNITHRVEAAGHVVCDSVRNGVHYLACGEKVGATKTNAAKAKGVTVITEAEMWDIIKRNA